MHIMWTSGPRCQVLGFINLCICSIYSVILDLHTPAPKKQQTLVKFTCFWQNLCPVEMMVKLWFALEKQVPWVSTYVAPIICTALSLTGAPIYNGIQSAEKLKGQDLFPSVLLISGGSFCKYRLLTNLQ